jgi:hypothetical protein
MIVRFVPSKLPKWGEMLAEARAGFRPWGETRFRTKNRAEFHALKLLETSD